MDAKNYLQQVFRLDKKIKRKENKLKWLKSKETALPSEINISGGKSAFSDKTGNIAVRIIDLENEILSEKTRLKTLRTKILYEINAVGDDNLCMLLEMRYLDFRGWKAISAEMGYSVAWVYMEHNRALKRFSEKFIVH